MSGLTIGYVHREEVSADFALSLALAARDFRAGVLPTRTTRIAYGRNQLLQAFLSTGSEWLLMVDTDILFTVDDVAALLRLGAPAACGWYNDAEGLSVARWWAPDERRMVPVDLPAEPTEIAGVGAGFLLVHRVVLQKMDDGSDPEFPWFAEGRRAGRSIGEDYEFCYRLHDRGIPLLLDPSVHVGHRKCHTV